MDLIITVDHFPPGNGSNVYKVKKQKMEYFMKNKTLIVYFSVYGTTKIVAQTIAEKTGADLEEIVPVIPYESNRDNYEILADYAKNEYDKKQRPKIKNTINISDYDTIFIGYPMWWYTMPMIMYTFFDSYSLSGKKIIPFNAHMGSNDGGTYATIKKMAPEAKILPGLPLGMQAIEGNLVTAKVSSWLNKLGY